MSKRLTLEISPYVLVKLKKICISHPKYAAAAWARKVGVCTGTDAACFVIRPQYQLSTVASVFILFFHAAM